jgi:hypothetical protein
MYANSGLSVDYVAALQRHADLYHQPPPRYTHNAQAPYWICQYLGHTVGTMNLSDAKVDVARIMFLVVTVKRPMPLTPASLSIW